MSNSDGLENLWIYFTFLFQGFLVGFCNLFFVVCSIGRYEALRSKNSFLIIIYLTMADTINMSAYFTAGIYRINVFFSNQFNVSKSVIDCMLTPHSLLWSFSEQLASLMLVVVSFDRLMAVSYPLQYIGWSRSYAYIMITTAYGLCLTVGGYGVGKVLIDGYESNVTIHAVCYSTSPLAAVHSSIFMSYIESSPQVFAGLSVLLYLVVWMVYRRKNVQVADHAGGLQKDQLKQQRKLTKSLGISCLCTLFLFVIPNRTGYIMLNRNWNTLAMSCFITSNFNSAANVIIYFIRHWEIRSAFTAMIACKTMPSDLRLWKANKEATQQIALKAINANQPVNRD